jgi:hypothetical protein
MEKYCKCLSRSTQEPGLRPTPRQHGLVEGPTSVRSEPCLIRFWWWEEWWLPNHRVLYSQLTQLIAPGDFIILYPLWKPHILMDLISKQRKKFWTEYNCVLWTSSIVSGRWKKRKFETESLYDKHHPWKINIDKSAIKVMNGSKRKWN